MILKRGLLGLILVGSFAGLAAPVVAASGWVLLVPPEVPGHGEGGTKFEVHAPLARWRQVKAFDTARACEDTKSEWWSQALNEVEIQLPYPPFPEFPWEKVPSESQATPPRRWVGLTFSEEIDEAIKENKKRDPTLTEEQKRQREHAESEWQKRQREHAESERQKARDKVDIARKPERQAVHERYRHWKCVPVDSVYQAPK